MVHYSLILYVCKELILKTSGGTSDLLSYKLVIFCNNGYVLVTF